MAQMCASMHSPSCVGEHSRSEKNPVLQSTRHKLGPKPGANLRTSEVLQRSRSGLQLPALSSLITLLYLKSIFFFFPLMVTLKNSKKIRSTLIKVCTTTLAWVPSL